MSKNELICLYAATQFSKGELIKLMAKQSYKLVDVKSNNHIHRYATPHRIAKKDKRLKTHHTINKRLHLTYAFQTEILKNRNFHLLDSITGIKINKKDVFDYIHCYNQEAIKIENKDVSTSCYFFANKDKDVLKQHYIDNSLDKHSEAVYITNILKKIGGKNDKKRISSIN